MHESEKWKWSHSSCLTLSDPMDCNLPGSSIHGIFQARVREWGAIAFSEYMNTVTQTPIPSSNKIFSSSQKEISYLLSSYSLVPTSPAPRTLQTAFCLWGVTSSGYSWQNKPYILCHFIGGFFHLMLSRFISVVASNSSIFFFNTWVMILRCM